MSGFFSSASWLEKRLRARVRDGAEVLHQFPVRHADAVSVMVIVPALSSVVTAMEGAMSRLLAGLVGRLVEAQPLARVHGVGNQLAHKDSLSV